MEYFSGEERGTRDEEKRLGIGFVGHLGLFYFPGFEGLYRGGGAAPTKTGPSGEERGTRKGVWGVASLGMVGLFCCRASSGSFIAAMRRSYKIRDEGLGARDEEQRLGCGFVRHGSVVLLPGLVGNVYRG